MERCMRAKLQEVKSDSTGTKIVGDAKTAIIQNQDVKALRIDILQPAIPNANCLKSATSLDNRQNEDNDDTSKFANFTS